MIDAIESITVGVDDLESCAALLRAHLGLQVLHRAYASVGQLSAWGHPVHEGVRLIELGLPHQDGGRIRLAQFESLADAARDAAPEHGPLAFSLAVSSPLDAVLGALQRAGCQQSGERLQLRDTTGTREATLLSFGRALPLLLTTGGTESCGAAAIVAADLEASRRFYGEGLGLVEAGRWRIEGAEGGGTLVEMQPAFGAEHGRLLLLHFPDRPVAGAREPSRVGRSGVGLCTCTCDDLDELEERVRKLGVSPLARPLHVGLPQGRPGRIMLVRGPDQELLELVDTAA